MPDWPDWRKAMDDDDFWDEYEAAKATMSYKDFVKTSLYHKASELRKTSSKWSRLALNSPTQGTGIIILKKAMTTFFKWIVDNNLFGIVKICDLVHDEAVIEYPKSMPEVSEILKQHMEAASAMFCKALPIPAVPECGDHWIH